MMAMVIKSWMVPEGFHPRQILEVVVAAAAAALEDSDGDPLRPWTGLPPPAHGRISMVPMSGLLLHGTAVVDLLGRPG